MCVARGLGVQRELTRTKEEALYESVLQRKRQELKGRAKERWDRLTDDELEHVDGGPERFVVILQHRYGFAHEEAETEYARFLDIQSFGSACRSDQ